MWRPNLIASCGLSLALLTILGDEPREHEIPPAPSVSTPASADAEAEIRAAAQRFAAAFDRGSAAELAAHWTTDGEYFDEQGRCFVGRSAIEQQYEATFRQRPGLSMRLHVDAVRLVGTAAALEDGRAILEDPVSRRSVDVRYAAVHVKQDGQWLMARVRDLEVNVVSSSPPLADLEWLIGDWRSSHEGTQLDVHYHWIVAGLVMQRLHEVRQGDHVTASGTQIIGWDPANHAIRSWIFSSCGGYAVGTWNSIEGGWCIPTCGVTADGTSTTATNFVSRTEDGALAWSSTDRSLGDVSLPATDLAVLRRHGKDRARIGIICTP